MTGVEGRMIMVGEVGVVLLHGREKLIQGGGGLTVIWTVPRSARQADLAS